MSAAPGSGGVWPPARSPHASHAPTQLATTRTELAWVCSCGRECWPIRAESRCLCGHRLKDHGGAGRACCAARCACRAFFFIVAEGAWTLRCRCKHKAVEHDAASHACAKCKGDGCARFDSPWVCNCDHPWSEHKQVEVERQVVSLAQRMAGGGSDAAEAAAAAAAAATAAAAAADELSRMQVVQRGGSGSGATVAAAVAAGGR